MTILKVSFNVNKKYDYITVRKEMDKILSKISIKYNLTNILNKFGIMCFREEDIVERFRNVIAFYAFCIKLNDEKVIYEIENTGLVTKDIEEVVECFRNFWD